MADPRPLEWRSDPAGSDRALIILKVMACFMLLGPPIGALTFLGLISAAMGRTGEGDPGGAFAAFIFLSLYGAPLSYLMGWAPAAATGAVVALWQAFRGRMGFVLAAAIGIGCGLIVAGSATWQVFGPDSSPRSALAPVLLTCLVPTLICWFITRNAAIRPPSESP